MPLGEIIISIKGRLWNIFYWGKPPWDTGKPQKWLVKLVDNGRLKPCKTIDLGCGEGRETIYLAKKGFKVIGVDFSNRAINKARLRAKEANVDAKFLVGDVTNLKDIKGKFDLVVDNTCLHTIYSSKARDKYVQTVLNLTKTDSHYFLRCFVKDPVKRVNPISSLVRLGLNEVEQRFDKYFEIEKIRKPFPGMVVYIYLMTRKPI
jgi:SAM-dependent methyltransferase